MWPEEAREREQKSCEKAQAGEISWQRHHKNGQAIQRVLYIKADNRWAHNDCDTCGAHDVRTFTLYLEAWFARITLSLCKKCGERLASLVDAKLDFVTRKEIRKKG